MLFLGRIHSKKGPDLLLRAFREVSRRFPDLHLVMAGPDEEGFRAAAAPDDRVTWTGLLESPELRFGALHAADVFVLPSHSENFGLAVVEALARGLPVLISERVNIWRGIVEDGAGFAENDDLAGTTALLERWLALSDGARDRMRCKAAQCFERRFEISRATGQLMQLLTTSVRSPESLPRAARHSAGTPR
jgi:glycosyltransferase involved in cell wall biosynthesis